MNIIMIGHNKKGSNEMDDWLNTTVAINPTARIRTQCNQWDLKIDLIIMVVVFQMK